MKPLPLTVDAFEKRKAKFNAWLTTHGAEILGVTNPYEVFRFKAGQHTLILYRNGKDQLNWLPQIKEIWEKFDANKGWTPVERTERLTPKRKKPIVWALLKRDGEDCFFCWEAIADGEESIEHLVPVAHGGPNHISNLVLSHVDCNNEAGHLSAMEKIQLCEAKAVKKFADRAKLQQG